MQRTRRLSALTFVNGPANRQRPPKPQLWRKCNCCCDGSSVANIFWIILCTAIKTNWSFETDNILLIFWSSKECLNHRKIHVMRKNILNEGKSYITGKTRGNTTDPSAKYWYNTRVSVSSVEYLTNVASTVNTNACVDKSGNTSGSSKTFDSFDTDDRDPRSCFKNLY